MSLISLFVLMLVSECWCSPIKISGGFKTGVHSKLDLVAGGSGAITRDGLAFMGDGKGVLGANWNGGAYGGAYGGLNDNYVAAQATGNAELGAALQPSIHTALGIDSKGQIPLAFSPSVSVLGNAGVGGNAMATTGNDARSLAALFGDAGAAASIKADKSVL